MNTPARFIDSRYPKLTTVPQMAAARGKTIKAGRMWRKIHHNRSPLQMVMISFSVSGQTPFKRGIPLTGERSKKSCWSVIRVISSNDDEIVKLPGEPFDTDKRREFSESATTTPSGSPLFADTAHYKRNSSFWFSIFRFWHDFRVAVLSPGASLPGFYVVRPPPENKGPNYRSPGNKHGS